MYLYVLKKKSARICGIRGKQKQFEQSENNTLLLICFNENISENLRDPRETKTIRAKRK
jgi:hypothetical protein